MECNKHPIRVYLVEDFKLTRTGIKSSFKNSKIINFAGEAEDAYLALKEIPKINPDVVLMDIGLPGMNGLEATRRIKELLPKTKIIILTSHDSESEVIAALSSGATGYCLKTISSKLLETVIETVNSGACWLDSPIGETALKYLPKIECVNSLDEVKLIGNRYMLSPKELDVLKLVAGGKSNEEISKEMFISVHTAKIHIGNILRKLSVCGRTQAAVKALKEKIIE